MKMLLATPFFVLTLIDYVLRPTRKIRAASAQSVFLDLFKNATPTGCSAHALEIFAALKEVYVEPTIIYCAEFSSWCRKEVLIGLDGFIVPLCPEVSLSCLPKMMGFVVASIVMDVFPFQFEPDFFSNFYRGQIVFIAVPTNKSEPV